MPDGDVALKLTGKVTPILSSNHIVSGAKEVNLSLYICVGFSSKLFRGIRQIKIREMEGTIQINFLPFFKLNFAILFAIAVCPEIVLGGEISK